MSWRIPLVAGNPAQDPASYSRFVLPFAYELVQATHREGPVWLPEADAKPEPHEDERQHSRERYFTAETATVLYRRTGRFRLGNAAQRPKGFKVPRRGGRGSYRVEIATPRLILFEMTKSGVRRSENRADLLTTGFLVLELFFPDPDRAPSLDELLELNEVFRHFVPPYRLHAEDTKEGGGRRGMRTVLGDLSVDLAEGGDRCGEIQGDDDLERLYFERWASLLERPLQTHPGQCFRLFPREWAARGRNWYRQPLPDDGTGWVAHADSRAFVWTCALTKKGLGDVRERFGKDSSDAAELGYWIKLLNVDAPDAKPESASDFEKEWARERTMIRWQHLGTVYGFAYHGGAALAPAISGPDIWRDFGDYYFDQSLLLLYLRLTSFRFSRELSRVTAEARDQASREWRDTWHRDFKRLRRDFAFFTNLYQFPLLSNQQQGVELYALARRVLDVDDLFKEIQGEVESTHALFEMEVARDQSDTTTRLTVVATVGLLLSIVVGFFGMNILFGAEDRPVGRDLMMLGFGVVVAWIILGFVNRSPKRLDRVLRLFQKDHEDKR